jgi:phosphoenolpyruvate carboxylase
MSESSLNSEREVPFLEDVRLLGRILGDTVREQEGTAVFEMVERIRQTSVAFDRHLDEGVRGEFEAILNELSGESSELSLSIIRAFTYFLHLVNIAEDGQQIRQRRILETKGAAAQPGSLDHTFEKLALAGIDAAQLKATLATLLVSPVLTAHPTEVSRKSILSSQHEIARLLDTA